MHGLRFQNLAFRVSVRCCRSFWKLQLNGLGPIAYHTRTYCRNLGSSPRKFDHLDLFAGLSFLKPFMGKSFARFTPFARGSIVGKAEEGADRRKIRKDVRKKDGKMASIKFVDKVLADARADPHWHDNFPPVFLAFNSGSCDRPQDRPSHPPCRPQPAAKRCISGKSCTAPFPIPVRYCKFPHILHSLQFLNRKLEFSFFS